MKELNDHQIEELFLNFTPSSSKIMAIGAKNYRDYLKSKQIKCNKKTIEQIKDEYAQEAGFEDFYDYLKNSTIGEIDHHCSHVAVVYKNQF